MPDATFKPQICAKCGEENPAEAEVCWACYWPAGRSWTPGVDEEPKVTVKWEDELGNSHPVPPRTWLDQTLGLLPPLSYAALFSAGWWRGKTRFVTLGGALAGFALSRWLEARRERERERQSAGPMPRQTDWGRLIDSILRRSLSTRATQIRLTRQGSDPLRVEFCHEKEWRLQYELSWRLWSALQMEVCNRAWSDTIAITDYGVLLDIDAAGKVVSRRKIPLSPEEKTARFAFRLWNEPPRGEIVLTRL